MKTVELNFLNYKCNVIVKDPNEHIQKHWASGNFYEVQRNGLLSYIAATEPKGMKIIDIGASIGNHSLFFNGVMEASRVISFEPSVDSYKHLLENYQLNGFNNGTAFNCALGSRLGSCQMKDIDSSNVGMKQVVDCDPSDDSVSIYPLDNWGCIRGYDLIKIDVEHYNEPLLIGAKETFSKGTGNIYIEAETDDVLAITDKYMTEYGYTRVPDLVLNHTPTYKYIKA